MTTQTLKEKILNENYVEEILNELKCGHIRNRGNYISASNPDGDNSQAIIIYLNENLTCINYTRKIVDSDRTTDIFDLITFIKDCTFPEALNFCCQILGIDYYAEEEDIPEAIQLLRLLEEMEIGGEVEYNKPLKPIPEKILSYYLPFPNEMFKNDGINYSTQMFFEDCFDPCTNSIAIPIRDELGNLVGVKARRWVYDPEKHESKYFYLEPCAKSKVLYGLYQNIKMIQKKGVVYVGESEKFVQQLYDMGYFGVSTGGSKISRVQADMLARLNAKIVFCYDEDIDEETLKSITSLFLDGIPIYAMIDKDNILDEKESPSDSIEKWQHMIKNNIYQIK